MILQITTWILEAIRHYGGWSVFLGVLVEQVIIPIPSPTIIMGAGLILIPASSTWLAALVLSSLKIVLPGVLASLLGAWGTYYLGYFGGRVFVDKFERFLGFGWKDVESLGHHFSKSGVALTFFSLRALPVVPLSLVSIMAGVLEVSLPSFLLWSFLGTIPRCYILALLGWQLGSSTFRWSYGVNRFESAISLLMVLLVIAGIIYIRHHVKKKLDGR